MKRYIIFLLVLLLSVAPASASDIGSCGVTGAAGATGDLTAAGTDVIGDTDDTYDLGSTTYEFKDLFLDGIAHVDTLDVDINATVAGTLGVAGVTTVGDDILTDADNADDIGATATEFKDLFLDGTAHIDTLDVDVNAAVTGTLAVGGVTTVGDDILTDADNADDIGASATEFKDLFLDGTAHIDTLDVDINATVAGTLGVTGLATFTDAIDLETTGMTLILEDGTAASTCVGTETLNGTTAVTIATTCIATGDYVFLTRITAPTTGGAFWATNIVTGTSFDIDSDNASDDGDVNWIIIKGQ